MEGIGGAKEEVTWQRYNGVRRSKFIAEEDGRGYSGGGELVRQEEVVIDNRDQGRRFVAQKDRKDAMWTEITKDLVSKEAIDETGYDYEETEFFFYVMVYLRYVSLLSPHINPPPLSTSPLKSRTANAPSPRKRKTSSASWSSPKTSNVTAATASEKSSGSEKSAPSGRDRS